MNCQTLRTTECVGMKLPKQNYQDAIISVEVCLTEDLIKTLFPSACERILSLASLYSSEECVQKNNNQDFFQEASVSAISPIFGPRIGNAIEKSQLREWEKADSSHDTTDCVSIEVQPQQPHNGIFRLRIGFIAGTYIANKLYA